MAISTKPVILDSGDRLTRVEFHRRYCARPDIKKAELVEGVVYVASPVRSLHGEPHACVIGWLFAYQAKTPGVRLDDNSTVILDADNEVQPDASLWREEPGGPRLTEDGYIEGAPQFVVEVAASSASYDLHDKMRAYLRNRVQEYIVWRVLDEAIDWFRLVGGEYVRVEPDESGIIESAVFPSLRLHVARMLSGRSRGGAGRAPVSSRRPNRTLRPRHGDTEMRRSYPVPPCLPWFSLRRVLHLSPGIGGVNG